MYDVVKFSNKEKFECDTMNEALETMDFYADDMTHEEIHAVNNGFELFIWQGKVLATADNEDAALDILCHIFNKGNGQYDFIRDCVGNTVVREAGTEMSEFYAVYLR